MSEVQPSSQHRKVTGKALFICGIIWFGLTFFWLPPLMLILGWFRLPERFYAVLLPGEFVMSALLAATGAVLWNRERRHKLSAGVALAAYGLAATAIVAVFNLYGWLHLRG
jgi:hypothetical protein